MLLNNKCHGDLFALSEVEWGKSILNINTLLRRAQDDTNLKLPTTLIRISDEEIVMQVEPIELFMVADKASMPTFEN